MHHHLQYEKFWLIIRIFRMKIIPYIFFHNDDNHEEAVTVPSEGIELSYEGISHFKANNICKINMLK